MNASTVPFALGCSGVTLWCLNPSCVVKSANSVLLNGGPLSDVAKMCFIGSCMLLKEVDATFSTTGYLVLVSMMTM